MPLTDTPIRNAKLYDMPIFYSLSKRVVNAAEL